MAADGTQSHDNETVFQNAIKQWWESKKVNAKGINNSQGGTRDHNLRGDTMDGFRDTIIHALLDEGVDKSDIFYGGQLSKLASNLPSYYRASKNWDVIVCKNSHYRQLAADARTPIRQPPELIAAIEFKSQHESIGNNQNNRIEESIGNAHDFWASYENRNFVRLIPRPWLGYLFVGCYAQGEESKGVRITQPHFPSDAAFESHEPKQRLETTKYVGPSYAERYRIFLERMIAKKLYDGACFLVTHEDIATAIPNYRVLYSTLSGETFLDALRRHIRAYYPS